MGYADGDRWREDEPCADGDHCSCWDDDSWCCDCGWTEGEVDDAS